MGFIFRASSSRLLVDFVNVLMPSPVLIPPLPAPTPLPSLRACPRLQRRQRLALVPGRRGCARAGWQPPPRHARRRAPPRRGRRGRRSGGSPGHSGSGGPGGTAGFGADSLARLHVRGNGERELRVEEVEEVMQVSVRRTVARSIRRTGWAVPLTRC